MCTIVILYSKYNSRCILFSELKCPNVIEWFYTSFERYIAADDFQGANCDAKYEHFRSGLINAVINYAVIINYTLRFLMEIKKIKKCLPTISVIWQMTTTHSFQILLIVNLYCLCLGLWVEVIIHVDSVFDLWFYLHKCMLMNLSCAGKIIQKCYLC